MPMIPSLRCRPSISDSYPRSYHGCRLDPGTGPFETGRDLPDEDLVSQLLEDFSVVLGALLRCKCK